jgi:hypothetical protein
MGRIKRGGGNGGEPARSPLGRRPYAAAWLGDLSPATNRCGVPADNIREEHGGRHACLGEPQTLNASFAPSRGPLIPVL